MVTLEPILDADLDAVGDFLHRSHDPTRSAAAWARLFRYPWERCKPNNGFCLRHNGAIVGVAGAIYSDQVVRGSTEHFCNITSWVVADSHRSHSTRLLNACLSQPGYHFTNFSPMPVVQGILKFLKFAVLDSTCFVVPCRPWPLMPRCKVVTGDAVARALNGPALQVYSDHRTLSGLLHAAVDGNYIALAPSRVKHLPALEVLHAGDAARFTDALPDICSHFFMRGCLFLKADARFLTAKPAFSSERPLGVPKYFRSGTLQTSDISSLYSERVLL